MLYALLTAVFMVMHRWIASDAMAFSFMNGLSFFCGFICVLFVFIFIKTAMVLFSIGRYCDERGELRRLCSWFWFMHYLYCSRLKVMFPFPSSRIDYAKIDKAFCEVGIGGIIRRSKGDSMFLIPDLPLLDEDSSLSLMASTFRNFAEMSLIGITCVVAGVASNCIMMGRCVAVEAFLLGAVLAVVGYVVLRLALVLLKAAYDVGAGKYTYPRVILYFVLLLFPLGTIFAIRSLRILRTKEIKHCARNLGV